MAAAKKDSSYKSCFHTTTPTRQKREQEGADQNASMTTFFLAFSAVLQDQPIKKLEFLVGDWQSKEEATSPDGKKTEFTLDGTNRWIFDGNALKIEESFQVPGVGKFENLILMTYDTRDKTYRAWWYTNRSPKPIEFTGDFVEKNFVLTTVSGSTPKLRVTYKNIGSDKFDAALEVDRQDKWVTQTVATYTRKKK